MILQYYNIINFSDTSVCGYKWTFKIIKLAQTGEYFQIGIDSSNDQYTNAHFAIGDCEGVNHSEYYSFQTRGFISNWDMQEPDLNGSWKIVEGDTVMMVLDVYERMLCIFINGEIDKPVIVSNNVSIPKKA